MHLPTNNQPLARYEEARAEIEARGDGAYVVAPRRTFGGFFAMLFGGGGSGGEEDDSEVTAPAPSARKQWASLAPRSARSGSGGEAEEESAASGRSRRQSLSDARDRARRGRSAAGRDHALSAGRTSRPSRRRPPRQLPSVRAPLPPQRPASLTAFADRQIAYDRSAALAAVDRSRELQSAVEYQQSDGSDGGSSETLADDAPPRRRAKTSAPMPPSRPGTFDAKATSAIARLVDSPKTEARKSRATHRQDSLAYAPEAKGAD